MEYHSQYGQDKYVDKYYEGKRNGVFLDIGAHNGEFLSNSYFLEKERGWNGVCFEPNPRLFKDLISIRNCVCIEGAASNQEGIAEFLDIEGVEALGGLMDKYDERHHERIDKDMMKYGGVGKKVIEVKCYNVNKVLEENGFLEIDYCSIDTEGGELDILKSIDYDKVKIKMFTIEVNYPETGFFKKILNHFNKNSVHSFLRSKGYKMIHKLNCDEVYVLSE